MQQILLNIISLLISFIPFLCTLSPTIPSKLPIWSWDCENEVCVPVKNTDSQNKFHSLETCNMLCSRVHLWPIPTGPVKLETAAVAVRAESFQADILLAPTTILRQHLQDAFELFQQDIRNMEGDARGVKNEHSVIVRISVNESSDPRMLYDTDESYHLILEAVATNTLIAEIVAASFCGARHALETLSQLVWLDPYMDSLLIIQEAIINDRPKFRYRGLMIDTARNYIPFSELLRTVDVMAASKLNTLHWHASDSQAFSLQLNSVPFLAQYGAYGPSDIYTTDQIKALVRRARLRGIRVVIEIDVPAHIHEAWDENPKKNHATTIRCTNEPKSSFCESPPCYQLNPLNSYVVDLLQNIYTEIIKLTGVDDIFHLGGDDVSEICWEQYLNGTDPMALWLEFTRSALQRLEYINGKMPNLTVFWSSRLSDYIKTDLKDLGQIVAFQIRNVTWNKQDFTGVRTIISHEDVWDLNSGFGAWFEGKDNSYNSWQRFYEYRPWIRRECGEIEGGEATLWSWTVGEEGLNSRAWPRAAALAERLWSDRPEGATRDVYARLDVHRTRLALRGDHCAPIWSYWCTQNPYTCN